MPDIRHDITVSQPLDAPSLTPEAASVPLPAEAAGAEPEEGEQVVVTVRVRAPHPSLPPWAVAARPARRHVRSRRVASRRWSARRLVALVAPALDIALALVRRLLTR